MKRRQDRDWHLIAETAAIIIIISLAVIPAGCQTQLASGRTYTFSGPAAPEGEIYSYLWKVTDGTPTTSTDASFKWTAPYVTVPTKVMLNLTVRSNKAICPGKSGLELMIMPGAQPKISLKKDCLFTPPVRVGDLITYIYNVTNSGNVPLTDINLTDMQDWGPDCHPVYVSGDDGDGMLKPGEIWRYECNYVVPNPSDYQRLHTMSVNSTEDAIVQRLIDMKDFLERKMNSLKPKRQRFDAKAAKLTIDHKLLNGTNYTLYNYTNDITGESLSRWLDFDGKIIRSDYYDPVTQAIIISEYNSDGSPESDSILLVGPKEYLKIEYNVSSNIYKNYTTGYTRYTVIDYNTGDTLILLVHYFGKIVSKEYRKTPGYKPYEEKFFLKNTASVTGRAPDGSTASDMDSFSLEIYKQLPVLKITKKADPDPVSPGGIINYAINYENMGKEDAHQIKIKEKYDQSLTFLSADPAPDPGTIDTWTLGDLLSGVSGTIKINTRVSPNIESGSTIMNIADLASKEGASDRAMINTTVYGLNITKSASSSSVMAGDTMTYAIDYRNYGSEVQKNAIVDDYLDPNVDFLSSSPLPTGRSGSHCWWAVGDLSSGASGKISIDIKVKDSASNSIYNNYKISSDQTKGKILTLQTPVSSLWITKSASSTGVKPGSTMTYTIDYGNIGSTVQKNAIINDSLDLNVDFLDSSPLPTGSSGNNYWWAAGDLSPKAGGKITIDIKVKDSAKKSINNIYGIHSDNDIKGIIGKLTTDVVTSLWINKTADKTAYSPGDNVTYTIKFGNNEEKPDMIASSVTVFDLLPNVELLSVSLAPSSVSGNTLRWDIGDLNPQESRTIIIMVQIPKRPDIKFKEDSSVKGVGYAYINKKLSTAEERTALVNKAYISGKYPGLPYNASATSAVTILGAAGTQLSTFEHGSGYYKEDEKTSLRFKNHSISLSKDLTAQHKNTSFSLPRGRSIKYESPWSDRTSAENHVQNDAVSENYLYMNSLDKQSSFRVDMNQTVYHSESDFDRGIARIKYEMHVPNSTTAVKEINENYHGSFRVLESVDSYGGSTKYSKSSKGTGFVSSDTRTNQPGSYKIPELIQRSYESGSGYYNSEETSQLTSVTKIIKTAYAPTNISAGTVNISYGSLWYEGMITKDPSVNLVISENIRSAPDINKDAWMDTSSLSFMGKFYGSMDIEASRHPPSGQTKDVEQSLIGNYAVSTSISFFATPKYSYPHVSITKEAIKEDESTIQFLINVTNDGNGLLKPLYVTDRLPSGMTFINSSLRPAINGQTLNWTVSSLDISRKLTIKVRVKVENDLRPYTNIAKVTAHYNGHLLSAQNSTTFTPNYLPCCIRSNPRESAYIANTFNTSVVQGEWGAWRPAPSFNVTSEATDCFKEIDEYYDDLDKCQSDSCPISSYDVP